MGSIEMKESKPTEVANRWSNIAKAAKESQKAASDLLADITNVKDNDLKNIQDSENTATETIKSLEDLRDQLMEKFEKLNDDVADVDSGSNFNETLNNVLISSQQTVSSSKTVADDAEVLDRALDVVDDVITDIPAEMTSLKTEVDDVKEALLSNKAAWVNAANAKNKVVAKINSLNVGGKKKKKKKKIQLT